MKTISISDLKAGLSGVLRLVRGGGVVIVTDRGRPVARLMPVRPAPDDDVAALVEAGLVRGGTRGLPAGFLDGQRPADPEGTLLTAVLEEREGGY